MKEPPPLKRSTKSKSHKVHRSRPILSYSLSRDSSSKTCTSEKEKGTPKSSNDTSNISNQDFDRKQSSHSTHGESSEEKSALSGRIRESVLNRFLQATQEILAHINNDEGNSQKRSKRYSLEAQETKYRDDSVSEKSHDSNDASLILLCKSRGRKIYTENDPSISRETLTSSLKTSRSCCCMCSSIFIILFLLFCAIRGYIYIYDKQLDASTTSLTQWSLTSNYPSMTPSQEAQSSSPTMISSLNPTKDEIASDTKTPSSLPTDGPTMLPSLQPSMQPTQDPSTHPSISPTTSPSQPPTVMPSDRPSVIPSVDPSVSPTDQPSMLPSLQPSMQPTVDSSTHPSISPTPKPKKTKRT